MNAAPVSEATADILAENVLLMPPFCDKLACQVFQTLASHISKMEICYVCLPLFYCCILMEFLATIDFYWVEFFPCLTLTVNVTQASILANGKWHCHCFKCSWMTPHAQYGHLLCFSSIVFLLFFFFYIGLHGYHRPIDKVASSKWGNNQFWVKLPL